MAYIGLGANLGEGRRNLLRAWRRLGAVPGITARRLSRLWRSEPVGGVSEQWFTNAVGELDTELAAEELLALLLRIETELGRDRQHQGFDRPIDLDLLLYGDQVINLPHLVVPHPEMRRRRFVLEPLRELAPTLVPPGARQNIATMAASLAAVEGQRLIPEDWDE
ncbi:2-amino-4-hydroxy-6-hydroxymethyldihydropteridine diphosphokinase [Desulfurivibrio dismutans]|uniref:2-amino-4-hydroxy-6- hydroxymethyldihydropteridine diphosphokinase n=1 Tax=Desulfurivibrio dismutans TaxID=1398908 RepID=UPI0023DACCB9|nr:2-amino-4-hydroxy-6-hydroxymethyldihydropteridine diphosphokinase [Desulfurivibrio alkaliphilus]MDF1613816.1 2-amino-4-hydroxy-6-hydroxymethyldihydropteridine diphosphokinase [Desulfurivibrio alkaliphilus]